MRAFAGAVLSAFAIGACTLVYGGKLDGVSGGTLPNDGGSQTTIDGATPPGSDAGNTGVDGGSLDAGSVGDAGFCAQHTTSFFCDDFDNGKALSVNWPDDAVDQLGSTLAIVSDRSSSAPSSLLATTPHSDDANNEPTAGRSHVFTFDHAISTFTISMALFIDSFASQSSADCNIALVDFKIPGFDQVASRIVVTPDSNGLDFNNQYVVYDSFANPGDFHGAPFVAPVHQWTRITRVISLANRSEAITVDNLAAVSHDLPEAFKPTDTVTVTIGIQHTDPGDGYRIYTDDVTIDGN